MDLVDLIGNVTDTPARNLVFFVVPPATVLVGVILGTLLPSSSPLNRLQRSVVAIPLAILISVPQYRVFLEAVHRLHFDAGTTLSLFAVMIGLWLKQGQAMGIGIIPKVSGIFRHYLRSLMADDDAPMTNVLMHSFDSELSLNKVSREGKSGSDVAVQSEKQADQAGKTKSKVAPRAAIGSARRRNTPSSLESPQSQTTRLDSSD